MNFCSVNFLFLFLPILLPTYFLAPKKVKNLILIISSFIFYFLGEKAFCILLLVSCIFNWFLGEKIYSSTIKTENSKIYLILGIAANLILLGIFKYLNFFINEINLLKILPEIPFSNIHLPIGISFFTFQAMAYIIDISRKKIKPARLQNFTLYLSLFPQLVAGPIIRFQEIEREISKRHLNFEIFSQGIKRFIAGLSKKVIIADTLAFTVDNIFSLNISELTFAVCLFGAICYTFQIYFDFSGYSDMAIGLGKMFGFKFPENFNFPYISTSIKEFWRRWHITLSGWFRDYLYIPLGGNRKNVYFNILIVFLMTGLWHGAGWNFIIWGLINGILICFERIWLSNILNKLPKFFSHIYFIFAVISGWAIFRSENLHYAIHYLKIMYGLNGFSGEISAFANKEVIFVLILAIILSTPVVKNVAKYVPEIIKTPIYLIALVISASYIAVSTYQPFIYFRF